MRLNIKNIDRSCMVIIAILTVSFGYWTFDALMNTREKTESGRAIYSKISDNLNNVQSDLEYLSSLRDKKKDIIELLNKRVPATPEVGLFLKTIDIFTIKRDLALISINPQTPVEEGSYTRIPVQIMLRGGFTKIYGLVHDLENMDRLIVIDSLKVDRSLTEKECRAELVASIYSFSQIPNRNG